MRFSLRFNNDLAPTDYPLLAEAAEQAGFDQFWVSNDLFLHGVWPLLTAAALRTGRIALGTSIVNPATIDPAEIAMQATTLDQFSHGRFRLGLAAGAAEFLGWVGRELPRPLTTTAATIRRLRALFAGEHGPFSDPGLPDWSREAYLRVPSRPIELYIGAMSPKMQALIGTLADGGLPLLFPPEQYRAVAGRVAAAAEAAGRHPQDIDLAACIWLSLDADPQRAEAPLRRKIAYYANAMSDEVLTNLGADREEVRRISLLLQRDGDLPAAAAAVSPQLMRIGIAGNAHQVIERLEQLTALGARHLSFGPPLGADPLQVIRELGRDVIPHFRRGRFA
jgi:5,10-methylenetetrahydromethanopterin reductase